MLGVKMHGTRASQCILFSDKYIRRFSAYRQLKKDAELIQAGHMDNRLEELCNEIMMCVI